ncbi:MAG TPA: hypothetical protein VGG51_05335 [Candidatus Cybelea sp.]
MNQLPCHRRLAILAITAGLAACTANRPDAGAFVPQATAPDSTPAASSPQPDSASLTYVVSYETNEILGFPLAANGNVAPTAIVGGSKTNLDQPDALAIDSASGTFFVANGNYGDHRILIFPKNSNGNVAPKVLGGSSVPIQNTEGLAVDAHGELYVSDYTAKAIYVFAAGASGNTAPIRTIAGVATELVQPLGMSFDSSGHLYVANGHDSTAPVEEFAAGANGNVAPIATIGGSHTKLLGISDVVLDPHNRIMVPNAGCIEIFAAGAHGNVSPAATIKGNKTTIVDLTTLGTDANGSIYGTNVIDIPNLKFSIIVFAHNASGNVAPKRILSGSHTHIIDTFYPTTL